MTCDCMNWMDYAYNGKCDDILNTEECFWDNGDCCRSKYLSKQSKPFP